MNRHVYSTLLILFSHSSPISWVDCLNHALFSWCSLHIPQPATNSQARATRTLRWTVPGNCQHSIQFPPHHHPIEFLIPISSTLLPNTRLSMYHSART
ncbi:hypothetical protein BDW69DRAFT_94810 [Aspergillus filifer]